MPPELHHSPAPLPHRSGLKVLVDLRDVLHDALPVRPVGPHELLNVLFGKVRAVKKRDLEVSEIRKVVLNKKHLTNVMNVNNIDFQNDIIPISPQSVCHVCNIYRRLITLDRQTKHKMI